jgi:hypothetical protein
MPKTEKGNQSEQVRIRTNYAVFIREEAERLNLNFLETLYHIINYYRINKGKKQLFEPKTKNVPIDTNNSNESNIAENADDDPLEGFD